MPQASGRLNLTAVDESKVEVVSFYPIAVKKLSSGVAEVLFDVAGTALGFVPIRLALTIWRVTSFPMEWGFG